MDQPHSLVGDPKQAPAVDWETVPAGHRYSRRRVVDEALSWVGTPYHHAASVKGAGVDCAHLLIEVYHTAGVAERTDPGFYRSGLSLLKRGERLYMRIVSGLATQQPPGATPLPGDVALFQFIHVTHGAIVLKWPYVIHAYVPALRVVISNIAQDDYLGRRFHSLWVPRPWCVE